MIQTIPVDDVVGNQLRLGAEPKGQLSNHILLFRRSIDMQMGPCIIWSAVRRCPTGRTYLAGHWVLHHNRRDGHSWIRSSSDSAGWDHWNHPRPVPHTDWLQALEQLPDTGTLLSDPA